MERSEDMMGSWLSSGMSSSLLPLPLTSLNLALMLEGGVACLMFGGAVGAGVLGDDCLG